MEVNNWEKVRKALRELEVRDLEILREVLQGHRKEREAAEFLSNKTLHGIETTDPSRGRSLRHQLDG